MKNKNHGEANDNDQWKTNKKVYKQLINFSGISKSEMRDATPLNSGWNQFTSWNAVDEWLAMVLWWMNHPWTKHQEFLPCAYENWIFNSSSFFILINHYGYENAFS
jgi:hypothetical protein